jgi:hypothetical protein
MIQPECGLRMDVTFAHKMGIKAFLYGENP